MDNEFQKASATFTLALVPELTGSENWDTFYRKLQDFLVLSDLWDALEEPEPTDKSPELANQLAKWKRKQIRTCTIIRSRCNHNFYYLVKDLTHPKTILDTLEKNCKLHGTGILTELYKQLSLLQKSDYSGVQEYAAKLREIQTKLENLGPEAAISKVQMIIYFLRGLGPAFEMFQASFSQTNVFISVKDQKAVSFDEAVMAATSEERRLNSLDTGGVAMIASHPQLQPDEVIVKKCGGCGKAGHIKKKCWKTHPELRPQKRRREDGDDKSSQKKTPPEENYANLSFTEPSPSSERIYMAHSHPTLGLDELIFDSACTKTTVMSKDCFRTYKTSDTLPMIHGIGGSQVKPVGIGEIGIACQTSKGPRTIMVEAMHCPELGANLLSIPQLTEMGAAVEFSGADVHLHFQGHTITGRKNHGLYLLNSVACQALTVPNQPGIQLWHQRMGHLGPKNLQRLAKMVTGVNLDHPIRDECVCQACVLGRMKSTPHKHTIRPGNYPLEFLHMDLLGPITPEGYDGSRYSYQIHCDVTKFGEAYTLAHKSDAFECFKRFKRMNETPTRRIRRIRSDNGGEFIGKEFQDFLDAEGIHFEPTVPGNPQQNGASERLGGILMSKAQPMMHGAPRLPKKYWPEAIRTANYLRMRSPVTGSSITPLEMWEGHKPDLSHIRTFGSQVYMPNRTQKKFQERATVGILLGFEGQSIYRIIRPDGKIIRASTVAVQEDISDEKPGLTRKVSTEETGINSFHNPAKRDAPTIDVGESLKRQRLVETYDPGEVQISYLDPVVDNKSCSGLEPRSSLNSEPSNSSSVDAIMNGRGPNPVEINKSSSGLELRSSLNSEPSNSSNFDSMNGQGKSVPHEVEQRTTAEPRARYSTRSTTGTRQPAGRATPHSTTGTRTPAGEVTKPSGTTTRGTNQRERQRSPEPLPSDTIRLYGLLSNAFSSEPTEPTSFSQAMRSDFHRENWTQAMQEEFDSLTENRTWDLVEPPLGSHVLSGKWVYKLKRGPHGEIIRYKARWVVRGFEQQEGIDYHETFASVVKPMSYKAIFAIAAANDLEIEQMDVKTAFLYGDIDEEIYVQQPIGLEDPNAKHKVCKLRKALYGLKQSPRIWYNTLSNYMKTLGFTALVADHSVFCRGSLIIAVYVDDLLIIGPDKRKIEQLKEKLRKQFKMTDLGPCHFYLGMTVTRDRPNRTLRLSQTAYIEKILRDHGMSDCKPVDTPMDPKSQPQPAPPGYESGPILRKQYQSAVGSLMYAMLGTRPDIAYAVSIVSRYGSNPTEAHFSMVKRILRYLRSTIHLQLTFRGELHPVKGYADADWAGDQETRRSTSGYVFDIGSAAISWSSKRQPTVALSTTEAESVAQVDAGKEAIWLKELLAGLLRTEGLSATVVYCDNQSAIALAKNPEFHARTKHFAMYQKWVQERISRKEIELVYIPSEQQIADGLTKALPRISFISFRDALGLEAPP